MVWIIYNITLYISRHFRLVIGLKMWDVTIGYKDVYNLFDYELFQVVEDGQKYSITLERLAMLKYDINDMRNFYTNDMRFLEQF